MWVCKPELLQHTAYSSVPGKRLSFSTAESLHREINMKRIFLGLPLACAVLLLSGCPDTKLPNPTPKVPEPKALGALQRTIDNPGGQGNALKSISPAAARRA